VNGLPPRTRPGAGVVSVGTCLPEGDVGTDAIASRLEIEPEWIVRRTGVERRRRARDDERLNDLAAGAARAALDEAQIDAADVDLILLATMTADDITPHGAAGIAAQLGATRAGTIDVNGACTGFLAALALAVGQVESGRAETVLVIGADLMSRVLDYDDRITAGIFGDGAGAVVVCAVGGASRVGPFILEADGAEGDAIHTPQPAGPVRMDGQRTFRRAVESLVDVSQRAAALAGVELAEIDLAVMHQANARITRAVAERLELPPERVVDCIAQYGNTTSASLPIALAHARDAGTLEPGARILLAAFGAGLAWGGTVLTWGR
jgi:3-oxoacyl-[acyl-carrier-protein] synthase-3